MWKYGVTVFWQVVSAGYMISDRVNVLVGRSNWAWKEAVSSLFVPRGVNPIVAADTEDVFSIIERRLIHTAIVDMDSDRISGLGIIRTIRRLNPVLPCILVSKAAETKLLRSALELNVFSVIDKPVEMAVLQDQLNRLFMKKYQSNLFSKS